MQTASTLIVGTAFCGFLSFAVLAHPSHLDTNLQPAIAILLLSLRSLSGVDNTYELLDLSR
jgi:hypothetical protein